MHADDNAKGYCTAASLKMKKIKAVPHNSHFFLLMPK